MRITIEWMVPCLEAHARLLPLLPGHEGLLDLLDLQFLAFSDDSTPPARRLALPYLASACHKRSNTFGPSLMWRFRALSFTFFLSA